MANLTNDGWFWGSSELDMHLTAAVFRAVEVRTPIVIAANTGFSASIDGCGRVLACGPRRKTATLFVEATPDGRWTLWLVWGSFLSGICVVITVTVALEHWVRRGTLT
jgi:apolipoprotein N-acyltransferase